MIGIREQITWIIYFLFFGYFLAVMNDILTYVLNKFRINQVLSYIFQLIFWLGLAYLATAYMMKITEGALTIYAFGFFVLGALIHMLYFSKPFQRDLARCDHFLSKIFRKVKKVIIIIVIPKEVLVFGKKLLPKKKTLVSIKQKFLKLFRREKRNKNEKDLDFDGNNIEPFSSQRL
jgi:hypothetical protein